LVRGPGGGRNTSTWKKTPSKKGARFGTKRGFFKYGKSAGKKKEKRGTKKEEGGEWGCSQKQDRREKEKRATSLGKTSEKGNAKMGRFELPNDQKKRREPALQQKAQGKKEWGRRSTRFKGKKNTPRN